MAKLSKPRARRSFTRYKRSETARLIRAAADAGHTVRGLEVDPVTGVLRLLFNEPDGPQRDTPEKVLKNL
jgi:hypothetical protein